jgi:hypothetical protein
MSSVSYEEFAAFTENEDSALRIVALDASTFAR